MVLGHKAHGNHVHVSRNSHKTFISYESYIDVQIFAVLSETFIDTLCEGTVIRIKRCRSLKMFFGTKEKSISSHIDKISVSSTFYLIDRHAERKVNAEWGLKNHGCTSLWKLSKRNA